MKITTATAAAIMIMVMMIIIMIIIIMIMIIITTTTTTITINELSREMCSVWLTKTRNYGGICGLCNIVIAKYISYLKPTKQTYCFYGTTRLITLYNERRSSSQLMKSFVSTLKSLWINAQSTCKFRDLMRPWYAYLLSQAVLWGRKISIVDYLLFGWQKMRALMGQRY